MKHPTITTREEIKALPDDAEVVIKGRLLKGLINVLEHMERIVENDQNDSSN